MPQTLLAAADGIELWEEPPRGPGRYALYHVRRTAGRWLATSYRRGEARALYRAARRGEAVESRWSEQGLFLARWAGRHDDFS